MQILIVFLVGISGIITSIVGCYIGCLIKAKSNVLLASLFELSAGLMTGIVCFEMIPESIMLSNVMFTILFSFIGVILTIFLDIYLNKKNKETSFLIIISMFIHNVVEGIAIGSAFSYSYILGISLLISTSLHDIPESIVVGISLNKDNISLFRRLKKAIYVGISVGIGAFFGNVVGNISDMCIAFCLSVSGGCMLYIVSCDLIPSSKQISNKKIASIIYIIGIIISPIITLI